jgi:hypothetical protein
MACTKPRITGAHYLFSAALDLAGGPLGLIGEFQEWALGIPFIVDAFDSNKPLIGRNPYRYAHMDVDGARELARLIKETDDLLKGFDAKAPFPKRVFAAHSKCDIRADIQGIEKLREKTESDRFTSFFIPKDEEVSHASLVLEEPIYALDAVEGEDPLASHEKRTVPIQGSWTQAALIRGLSGRRRSAGTPVQSSFSTTRIHTYMSILIKVLSRKLLFLVIVLLVIGFIGYII